MCEHDTCTQRLHFFVCKCGELIHLEENISRHMATHTDKILPYPILLDTEDESRMKVYGGAFGQHTYWHTIRQLPGETDPYDEFP